MSERTTAEVIGEMTAQAMDLVGDHKIIGAVLLVCCDDPDDDEGMVTMMVRPPDQGRLVTSGIIAESLTGGDDE